MRMRRFRGARAEDGCVASRRIRWQLFGKQRVMAIALDTPTAGGRGLTRHPLEGRRREVVHSGASIGARRREPLEPYRRYELAARQK